MQMKKLVGAASAIALALALAGCGGGGNDGPAPDAALLQSYGSALQAADSASGINATALKESFDAKYLDAGITRDTVVASLDQDAQAMAASTEYSAFPRLQISEAKVDNCGSDGVCTLSGTLVNGDADSTSVPFSVPVINAGGVLRLYGDQKNS